MHTPMLLPSNDHCPLNNTIMNNSEYTIRTMTRQELNLAVQWAAEEGWNPGLDDANCYYAADPNGFLIGMLDDEPIASISVVKYGQSFGFLGFYIVKPEYRGQGYGIQIWDAGLKYLEGRNIGLDGVVAQQENYKKSGFKLAYSNVRYEGIATGHTPANVDIVKLSALPFQTIASYDLPFFPEDRTAFTKQWINQKNGKALGIMQNDKLAGYGVIRPCRSGYKIGPLIADTPDLAESLFSALQATIPSGASFYLDVPQVNHDAVAIAQRHNMKVVFETARMYTGNKPDLPLSRIFGVTSFEVG
jgi:GNAT superfamily N-acetyltransferase